MQSAATLPTPNTKSTSSEKAPPYHSVTYPSGQEVIGVWDHRGCLEAHCRLPVAGKKLIDIGCRDGLFSVWFRGHGADVTCLDVDDRAFRREMFREFNYPIPFIHKNMFELAYGPARQYDVAFMGDLLVHLENPLGALRILHHICRETAYVISDVHAALGDTAIVAGHEHLPLHFGETFLHKLLALAGWKNVRTLARFTIPGTVWKPRHVALLAADVNPDFDLASLAQSCATSTGNLQIMEITP